MFFPSLLFNSSRKEAKKKKKLKEEREKAKQAKNPKTFCEAKYVDELKLGLLLVSILWL